MKESKVLDILNAVIYPYVGSFILYCKKHEIILQICFQRLVQMAPLSYRKMDFYEFCAAAISTHQLEAREGWEQMASTAFEHFEREGNRIVSVEELARVCVVFLSLPSTSLYLLVFSRGRNSEFLIEQLVMQELNLGPPAYSIIKDWIRSSDGKLSFIGYTKFLHGVTIRTNTRRL